MCPHIFCFHYCCVLSHCSLPVADVKTLYCILMNNSSYFKSVNHHRYAKVDSQRWQKKKKKNPATVGRLDARYCSSSNGFWLFFFVFQNPQPRTARYSAGGVLQRASVINDSIRVYQMPLICVQQH